PGWPLPGARTRPRPHTLRGTCRPYPALGESSRPSWSCIPPRRSCPDATLEHAPPALSGLLHREVDPVADDEALAPHLAQRFEGHVVPPGELAQPTEVLASHRHEHPRLALAEQERVGTHERLRGHAESEAQAAERAFGEGDREAAVGHIV